MIRIQLFAGLLLCLVGTVSLANVPGGGGTQPVRGTRPTNLHIIAVGVNQYRDVNKQLANQQMAVSDARSLADSLMRHFCGRAFRFSRPPVVQVRPHRGGGFGGVVTEDTTLFYADNIYPHILTDQQATVERIGEAFQAVISRAKPNDMVVFDFAGYTVSAYDSTLREAIPYLVPYARIDSLERDLPQQGLSIRQLRDWLERIPAWNQLIITDACANGRNTAMYLERFLIAGKNPATFTPRNRVIVGPDGLVYEDRQVGGHLTHSLKQLGATIFDLFDGEGKRGRAYLRFSEFALQQYPREAFDIFFERAFWDDVTYLTADAATEGSTRGGVAAPTPKAAPKPLTVRNYALIIGTDQYVYNGQSEWKPLRNPVADARAVAHELGSRYAFDTTLLVNPTLNQVHAALRRLYEIPYDSSSQVLVFIAGHGGYETYNTGFLAFSDSKPGPDDPNRRTYLTHTELRDKLDRVPCRHVLVVLDACFGGTFMPGKQEADRGPTDNSYGELNRQELIRRKMPYKTRKYCTSGGKEYVPDGIPGHHSPFARQFLEALRSDSGLLTFANLTTYLERTNTPAQPCFGNFGDYDPGSDFLFIVGRKP